MIEMREIIENENKFQDQLRKKIDMKLEFKGKRRNSYRNLLMEFIATYLTKNVHMNIQRN